MVSYADFEILKHIGDGGSSNVYKVKYKKNGRIYAMKIINKLSNKHNDKKLSNIILNENNILQKLNNKYIIKLYFSFEDYLNIYFVLEYAEMGDLYKIINSTLSTEQITFYFIEILLGIQYLHENGIIMRDIKPENILIKEDGHIIIGDFGLAKHADRATTQCGTIEYIAPEIINNGEQTIKIDIWSIGILLYELIYKVTPFENDEHSVIVSNINSGKYHIDKSYNKVLNGLIHNMLQRDPDKRPDCNDIIRILQKNKMYSIIYTPPVIKDILSYNKPDKTLIRDFQPFISPDNNDKYYEIVLIDDDIITLNVYKEILNNFGKIIMKIYSDPNKALKYISSNKSNIELILLDYIIPKYDVNDIINHLQIISKSIPIILLTNLILNKNQDLFTENKIRGYIKKPLRNEETHKTLIMGAILQRISMNK
jgi:serine/threonine protein kinase